MGLAKNGDASLCVITSKIPPEICGVGDYTRQLWLHWPDPKPQWSVLAPVSEIATAHNWPEIEIERFKPCGTALDRSLERYSGSLLILNYVGFAYHPKGIPLWLPKSLARWKARHPDRRLLVMFHELWGESQWWRPSFYREFLQRRIIRELAQLSDTVLTSCESHSERLRDRFGVSSKVAPIPSNISRNKEKGWIDCLQSPTVNHGLIAIVFGRAASRAKALQTHIQLLKVLSSSNMLKKVVIVGERARRANSVNSDLIALELAVGREKVAQLGERSEIEVSDLMSEGHIFLSPYGPAELQKSGTFKSALLHGCPVIVACSNEANVERAPDNVPFLSYSPSLTGVAALLPRLAIGELRRHAIRSRDWYLQNSGWDKTISFYEPFISTNAR